MAVKKRNGVKDCIDSKSASHDNLLQLVFNIENAMTADGMQQVAREIADAVRQHPDKERIDRVLVRWFKRFLHQNKISINLNAINQLQEIPPMLANRVETWFEQWRQEGLALGRELGLEQGRVQGIEQGRELGLEQGLEQGREQGLEQGLEQGSKLALRQTLSKLAAIKFGSLPAQYAERIQQAETSQLELWTERILLVEDIDSLFA